MEAFSALLAICAGNSPVTGEFPAQRPVTQSFDVLLHQNKRLSKQWWGWWFETPSHPLWRRCNFCTFFIPLCGSPLHTMIIWKSIHVISGKGRVHVPLLLHIAVLPTRLSLWHNVSHWNGNVVILTTFSSLAAPEVVFLTNSNAASDENFVKMTIFPFQRCLLWPLYGALPAQLALTLLSSVVFKKHNFIYLHVPSFHFEMTHLVEIFPCGTQGPTYLTQSMPLLLTTWRRKEPAHQQPWYWLCPG